MRSKKFGAVDTLLISDQIRVDRKSLVKLLDQHHVKKLSLFGSAARGDISEGSDIDLLIEFRSGKAPSLGGLVEISDRLSDLMGGRSIDLATRSILNNPFRRRTITRDLKILHET